MCSSSSSHSMKKMDNNNYDHVNNQGDLTDILRTNTANTTSAAEATAAAAALLPDSWHFPTTSNLINNYMTTSTDQDHFGHPFVAHLRDPLLHGLDTTPITRFFHDSSLDHIVKEESVNTGGFGTAGSINNNIVQLDHDQEMIRNNIGRPATNIFSRMLQISPNAAKLPLPPCDSLVSAGSPRPGTLKGGTSMLVSSTNNNIDHGLNIISPNSSKSCFVEGSGLQISSPRNTGIKRRKSQAKKVVCIPAPAPANSRSTGEIVPSDLWAWRKYGQKPIKGSPYPRGYYRCSSSKGCSARKQVERSRTDPNMLVITYTSEHNHPWPTQRNALAGSTRSQPSKNTSTKPSSTTEQQVLKEEQTKEISNTENDPAAPSSTVKEEMNDQDMDDDDQAAAEFNKEFPHHDQSYKPTLPDDSKLHCDDNFFASLEVMEADSLDMLLTHGFTGDDDQDNKSLDPYTFYDWGGNNNVVVSSSTSAGATTSYHIDQGKKDQQS